VTLPLLVPSFTANVTLLLAWGLRCFDYPMAVARNMEAAQTSAMFVYDYIFGYSKAGRPGFCSYADHRACADDPCGYLLLQKE